MGKKKIIFLMPAVILIFFGASLLSLRQKSARMIIGNNKIKVEIADDDKSRYRGLSGRKNLCADCGMLFLFDEVKERSFVMRDMNFPLDIIWIKGNKIIKIDENLPQEGHNPVNVYSAAKPVDMVLEVNGGFCDERAIEAGVEIEKVQILKFKLSQINLK